MAILIGIPHSSPPGKSMRIGKVMHTEVVEEDTRRHQRMMLIVLDQAALRNTSRAPPESERGMNSMPERVIGCRQATMLNTSSAALLRATALSRAR